MIVSISLFSSGILAELGFVSRRLSLIFILFAASVGTSGRMVLMRPAGMAVFEILFMIFLNVFSPLYTSGGGGSFANSASVSIWYFSQSALRKLIKVRLSLVMGFISVTMFMMIGRWSDPRLVLVYQEV